MADNTFDTEEVNLQIQPLPGYIDADGAFKLNTPLLSSFNFDGSIPKFDGQINAGDVEPGYLIQIESGGQYFPVVSIEKEEADLEDSPSGIISIGYIDAQGATVSTEYEETDQVSVVYEDWANKVLGSQGWGITAGGNAVFTNIAARGRIEAEEGYISGTLTIGSGGTTTVNDLTTAEDLDGFVTDTDLITNGATVINGNNITTGVIQANLIDITTNALPNRGVKLTALGLEGFDGSGNRTFYLNTNGSLDITGYATDGELSGGLSGKINNGGAATDVNNNVTNISGGKIRTGIIESNSYSGVTDGSAFSSNGLSINLTTGALTAEAFRVDTNGNAAFKGNVQALSGFFGSESINWSIGTEAAAGYTSAFMKSGTLKLYTTSTGTPPVQHGIITLDNGSGLSAGSLSNALSVPANKTVNALGNGLHIGTGADYLFIPGSGNTLSPRIRSNGFEFRNTSEDIAFKVGNDEISIPAATTINFWNDSQSPAAFLDYGPTNNQLTIAVGAGPGGSTFNGIVNFRASDVRLNGTSIVGGGGGGGGVTTFKFGDNGLTETGAVAITGAEIITGINDNSIPNAKLINKGITIGSTTRNLGGTFTDGDIDGGVITANTLAPGKISNASNLISIGSTGIPARSTINSINGLSTLQITGSQGLDYVFNLGFTPINLNRNAGNAFLSGVVASANNLTVLTGLSSTLTNNGLLYNATGLLGALGNGTSGQFLRSNGTSAPSWETVNPMTAFGDLIYGSTNTTPSTPARLAIGATGGILRVATSLGLNFPTWLPRGTAGQVLRVNSGGTDIEWGTLSFLTNPMTAAGQMIYGGTSGTPTALAAGSTGQILQSNGTSAPSWTSSIPSLAVSNAQGLNYVMNFGNSAVNLNRAAAAITLSGVTVDGLSTNTSLFTLGSTAITAGNTVANYSLNYNWYLGTTAISLGRANAAATLTGITLSGAKITTPPAGTTAQPFLRWNSATSDITQVAAGSSLRYKEIIEKSPEINSDWIDNIEIIKFKYNLEKEWFGDQAPIRIGLIAEEVSNLESINNVVEYDMKTGLPDAIEYDKIALLLIPEIKLLRQRVADLEARLDAAGL